MTDEEWSGDVRTLGLRLAGDAISETDARGHPIVDDTLLVVLNASDAGVDFRLPRDHGGEWHLVFDTTSSQPPQPPLTGDDAARPLHSGGSTYAVGPRSVCLFRLPRPA
jgi:glycogen operon protein